jgi:hypothetical protein
VPLEKSVSVRISVSGTEDAKLKIDALAGKAEELKKLNPTITPNIDAAKALVEARLLRAGLKAEFEKSITETVNVRQSALSRLVGASGLGGAGGSGLLSGLDSAGPGGLAGVTALLPVIGAVLVEAGALVAGLAAATAGVGAFGALALPTFDKIKNAYTAISGAQKVYNQAAAINKEDPTKAHAAAAAAALLKLKVAQESLSPSTRTAVTGIQDLMKAYDAMAKAFAPTVLKVFNDGLKIANQLLPALKPFAQAAGTAIDGLLKSFLKFTQSSGFQSWLSSFVKLVGPAITGLGKGIGQVANAIGQFIGRFSAKDVSNAISVFFSTISWSIRTLGDIIGRLMHNWDQLRSGVLRFVDDVGPPLLRFIGVAVGSLQILTDAVLNTFGTLVDSAALAFGWIPKIGPKLKDAAKAFDSFRQSVHDNLSTAQKNLDQWAKDLQNAPKIAKIKGDITDMQAKLKIAKQQLADPALKGETSQIKGNIAQLEHEIAVARAELARLNGTTATTYIATVRIGGPVPLPGTIPHRAAGGWASGPTLINELGPEVVDLPSGSYVHTAAQTRQMLSGNTYNINVGVLPGNEREAGRVIVNAIRKFEQGSGKGWRH